MSDLDTFADLALLEDFSDEGSQPKHERLRDYVATQIESGRLPEGMLLPSELRIAEIWNVARSTVRQAMATLERDGLIRRVHGKGTFVHEEARQRLKRGHDIFALVLPETEVGYYPSLQKSFEDAAAGLHGQVIVCNSHNDVDRQGNVILQLIDHRVAGVAIVPTTSPLTPAYHIRQLQKNQIPVVCCSRSVDGVTAPLLAIPFEDVGRKAGEAIRKLGHRCVAFFSGFPTESSRKMERGFAEALGPAVLIHNVHGTIVAPDVAAHEDEISAQLDQLLTSAAPPTALLTTFDPFAELLYLLLARHGVRVPEEISIVSFGGARRMGALASSLASVAIDEQEMGRQAIEYLNRMRQGGMPIESAERIDISIRLNEGKTLGPAPTTPRHVRRGYPPLSQDN